MDSDQETIFIYMFHGFNIWECLYWSYFYDMLVTGKDITGIFYLLLGCRQVFDNSCREGSFDFYLETFQHFYQQLACIFR